MARSVDFLRLYQEFGLEPNATIDDLKLAYRRRVSALHPDRLATDPISQHLAGEHLTRLTALYDAAQRFHQQHGRLPGALAPARGESSDPAPSTASAPALSTTSASASVESATGGSGLRAGRWLVGILVLALVFWTLSRLAELEDAMVPEPATAATGTRAPPAPPAARAAGIRVGMRADDVLRVMGEPVARTDERWDYGPSWIRFDKGRIVDWYSSPLRALRIDRTPAPEVDEAADGTE